MENLTNLGTKKYSRKSARGILTPKERSFLNNIPQNRLMNSNERHYYSSIKNKTTKALEDLDLIFKKLPYDVHSLFPPKEKLSSLERAIQEVTVLLYNENYPRKPKRLHTKADKKTTKRKTRRQIVQVVDSVLATL